MTNPIEEVRLRSRYEDDPDHTPTVQEFAAAIGCSYGGLYNAIRGFTEEPADIIARIVAVNPALDPQEMMRQYLTWRQAHIEKTRRAIRSATAAAA